MKQKKITLDFGQFVLKAHLFNSSTASKFAECLPCNISLDKWGDELYGSIGRDLGEENLVSNVPSGGIAYTRNGYYICIFFGQTPAWPVEYIGQIEDSGWEKLTNSSSIHTVTINLV